MLVKLAARNVRRSARDYAVYFITLFFGVAVFYAFNSVGGQSVVFDIRDHATARALEMTNYFLGLFSVLVALVLAFLVVYANRFIIKRRKREFGTYLLLGMTARKMSAILFIEMLMVGAASLVVGLAVGILLAQGLAFGTAALMGTTMSQYTFLVSGEAIVLTLVCFAIFFAASLVMNVFFVSKNKLGDLLTERSSMSSMSRVPLWVRVVGFFASLVVLAAAYWLLHDNAFVEMNDEFLASTILMIVGTVLLFWSGSTAILVFLSKADGFYLKRLHAFTARQISTKVGTAFASMSVVSIMLFFAIATVTVGFGCMEIFVGDAEEATQYDATVGARFLGQEEFGGWFDAEVAVENYADAERIARNKNEEDFAQAKQYDFDMLACLKDKSPAWGKLVKDSAQIDYYYEPGLKYGSVFESVGAAEPDQSDGSRPIADSAIAMVSLSQFNDLRALLGEEPVKLAENQFLVNNAVAMTQNTADDMAQKHAVMTVAGKKLTCADQPVRQAIRNGAMVDVSLEIIVPDSVIDALKAEGAFPANSYLDIMYNCDRLDGDPLFISAMHQSFPPTKSQIKWCEENDPSTDVDTLYTMSEWPNFNAYTGNEMMIQAGGIKLLCVYLSMYIGFILLVTTAAILAIQQLSETADSVARYRRLSSIGCDRRMILGSLRSQTVLYFAIPLAVALIHAAYAVTVLNGSLFAEFGVDPISGILVCGGLITVIYGCYGAVAYWASRSIVKENC